jgi:hypothetical protein
VDHVGSYDIKKQEVKKYCGFLPLKKDPEI